MKYRPIAPILLIVIACAGCVAFRTRRAVVIQREAKTVMHEEFPKEAGEYIRSKVRDWTPLVIIVSAMLGAGGMHGAKRFVDGAKTIMREGKK